jgi:hypothetical protein
VAPMLQQLPQQQPKHKLASRNLNNNVCADGQWLRPTSTRDTCLHLLPSSRQRQIFHLVRSRRLVVAGWNFWSMMLDGRGRGSGAPQSARASAATTEYRSPELFTNNRKSARDQIGCSFPARYAATTNGHGGRRLVALAARNRYCFSK